MYLDVLFLIADVLFGRVARLSNEWLSLMCFFVHIIWFPCSNRLKGNRQYRDRKYIDETSENNPLFVKGLLKNNNKNNPVRARLKGLGFCQNASILPLILAYVYMWISKKYGYRNYLIENSLMVILGMILLVWFSIRVYYEQYYEREFKYTENKEGIWMPFRFLTTYDDSWSSKDNFYCRYHVSYDDMKERLLKETECRNYKMISRRFSNSEKETIFFWKKEEGEGKILQIIHMKQYEDNNLETLNDIFVEFWKEFMSDIRKDDVVKFMFLLCVDEENRALKKKFFSTYSYIGQKKNRYRLGAILRYDCHDILDILPSGSKKHKLVYECMSKELTDLLEISVSDNGKDVFGNEENFGMYQ